MYWANVPTAATFSAGGSSSDGQPCVWIRESSAGRSDDDTHWPRERLLHLAPFAVLSDPNGKLAFMSLEELREEHRHWLFEDFLPFMDQYVVDRKYGGFMCTVDRDGTLISGDKRTWYEGRGIWVYSFLYNRIESDPVYLDIARRSVEFIMRHDPLRPELLPSRFTRQGKALDAADPMFYGDVFVANGLQEYSRSPGNEEYWDVARRILLKCVDIYDNRVGYADIPSGPSRLPRRPRLGEVAHVVPAASCAHSPGEVPSATAPTVAGVERPRICGHWMVLLNCAQQMLEVRPDAEIEAVARRSVDAVMNHHYNPDWGLISEYVNHDLSRIASEHGQLCTGHGPETLWMILYEALRTGDKQLFERAAGYLRRSAEVFWDDVYGGMFAGLEHVDLNIWSTAQKSLWLQQEMLIGMLCVIEHTGAAWAREWYSRLHAYLMEKFPLRQYGFPLWASYADRRISFVRHARRCENFHHPRYLMLNLQALERMIGRGGGVSGAFG